MAADCTARGKKYGEGNSENHEMSLSFLSSPCIVNCVHDAAFTSLLYIHLGCKN